MGASPVYAVRRIPRAATSLTLGRDVGPSGQRVISVNDPGRREGASVRAPRKPERRTPEIRSLPGFDLEHLGSLGLTRRELAVLELVAEGLSNEKIAQTLRISPLTVKKHLELMYARLAATNRASLVALAWQASQPERVLTRGRNKGRRTS